MSSEENNDNKEQPVPPKSNEAVTPQSPEAVAEEMNRLFGMKATQDACWRTLYTLKKVTILNESHANHPKWIFLNKQYEMEPYLDPDAKRVVTILNSMFTQGRGAIGIDRANIEAILSQDSNWKTILGLSHDKYQPLLKMIYANPAIRCFRKADGRNDGMSIITLIDVVAETLLGLSPPELKSQQEEVLSFVKKGLRKKNPDKTSDKEADQPSDAVVSRQEAEESRLMNVVISPSDSSNTSSINSIFPSGTKGEEKQRQGDQESDIGSDIIATEESEFSPITVSKEALAKALKSAIGNSFKFEASPPSRNHENSDNPPRIKFFPVSIDLKRDCREAISEIRSSLYSNNSKTEYPAELQKVLYSSIGQVPTEFLTAILNEELKLRFRNDSKKVIFKPGSWLHKGLKSEIGQVLKNFENAPVIPFDSESHACCLISSIADYVKHMDCMMEVRTALAPGLEVYFQRKSFLSKTLSDAEFQVLLAVVFKEPGHNRAKHLFFHQYLMPVYFALEEFYRQAKEIKKSSSETSRLTTEDELPDEIEIGRLYEECCNSMDVTDYDSLDLDGLIAALVSRPRPSAAQYVSYVGRHVAA